MAWTDADAALLRALRAQTLNSLGGVLSESREVVLLDTPRHRNFGDSLIWAGEIAYLRRLGRRVTYSADISSFRIEELDRRPDAMVAFHGGGNLGDLWPWHEKFRQQVVCARPSRHYVILPQSAHFSDPSAALIARAAYSRATKLTIALRDQDSFTYIQNEWPEVSAVFMPDAALGWDVPPKPLGDGDRELLTLARNDVERTAADASAVLQGAVEDWCASAGNDCAWRVLNRAMAFIDWPGHHLRSAAARPRRAMDQGLRLLNRAAAKAQLSGSAVVATNRLHAHIASSLLGIPNFVADNSYGKVSGVFEYTGRFSSARFCGSLEEANQAAKKYLQQRHPRSLS